MAEEIVEKNVQFVEKVLEAARANRISELTDRLVWSQIGLPEETIMGLRSDPNGSKVAYIVENPKPGKRPYLAMTPSQYNDYLLRLSGNEKMFGALLVYD